MHRSLTQLSLLLCVVAPFAGCRGGFAGGDVASTDSHLDECSYPRRCYTKNGTGPADLFALNLDKALAMSVGDAALRFEPLLADESDPNGTHHVAVDHLIGCALAPDQSVTVAHPDGARTFSGELGLAPSWEAGPVSDVERDWVQACSVARLNLFRNVVLLGIVGDHPALDHVNERFMSRLADPLTGRFEPEAGFRVVDGVPHVCAGPGAASRDQDWLSRRLCNQPGALEVGKLTACGVVYDGRCDYRAVEPIDPLTKTGVDAWGHVWLDDYSDIVRPVMGSGAYVEPKRRPLLTTFLVQ